MLAHLRANLWLLFLTVVICCVLYPAAVWVVGQTIFHNQAEGSLLDKDGNPVSDPERRGRLPADRPVVQQPLVLPVAAVGGVLQRRGVRRLQLRGQQPEAARPRGPAAGADCPLQRRLQEGATPRSDESEPNPQDDIVAWFKEQTAPTEAGKDKRDLFTEWATNNSTLAQAWATGTPAISDYILQWAKDHSADVIDAWKKDNPDNQEGPAGAGRLWSYYFFKSYAKEHFGPGRPSRRRAT